MQVQCDWLIFTLKVTGFTYFRDKTEYYSIVHCCSSSYSKVLVCDCHLIDSHLCHSSDQPTMLLPASQKGCPVIGLLVQVKKKPGAVRAQGKDL